MQYFLVRHGQTDANRVTRVAFGKQGAPLNESGLQQVKKLHQELLQYGFDFAKELVAVSELLRTLQTAEFAGFKNVVVNNVLNEVSTPDPQKTSEQIKNGILPREAILTARKVLANPPNERMWVTHGLVIAAIIAELKMSARDKLIPDFCEITQIEL